MQCKTRALLLLFLLVVLGLKKRENIVKFEEYRRQTTAVILLFQTRTRNLVKGAPTERKFLRVHLPHSGVSEVYTSQDSGLCSLE